MFNYKIIIFAKYNTDTYVRIYSLETQPNTIHLNLSIIKLQRDNKTKKKRNLHSKLILNERNPLTTVYR